MSESLSTRVVVSLPGGVTQEGQWAREAELHALSGREEDWLLRHPATPNALSVTQLLSECLLRLGGREVTRECIRQLLVGDRDFLVLMLRQLTIGGGFHVVLPCPACKKKMDVAFDATDVPIESGEMQAIFE